VREGRGEVGGAEDDVDVAELVGPGRSRLHPPSFVLDEPGELLDAFGVPPLTLDADDYVSLLRDVAATGLRGGAIYDAVWWQRLQARASAELLTLDARAAGAYRAVGATFRSPAGRADRITGSSTPVARARVGKRRSSAG